MKTKSKLLSVFLTLCMVLLLVPSAVFAVDVNLPSGVKYTSNYHHQYYTKVDVNANVSVKELDGTVVETKQVTKSSGDFIKGGLSDEAVQSTLSNIWSEIETSYKSQGTVKHENNDGKMTFDHFDSVNIYTFTPTIGDVITFATEEEAQQYFDEHQDATGTFNRLMDVYEYQIYKNTYDLIVEKNTSPAITQVNINSLYNYEVGSTPHATAKLSQNENRYEIAYECWEEMENGDPVAFWYSDESKYIPSMKRITKFEEGKTYMYSIELHEKDGYKFSDQCDVNINNKKQSTVIKTLNGLFIPAIDMMCPVSLKTIDSAAIYDVTTSYNDGDKPLATAAVDQDAKYDILYESWMKNDDMAYWYSDDAWYSEGYERFNTFDKDGTYQYSVRLAAKEGYTFSNDITLENIKINGNSLPKDSNILILDNGKSCLITYGSMMHTIRSIDRVYIDGATIHFMAGDQPVFTAQAEDYSPYYIDHERWTTEDAGVASSEYWNNFYGDFEGAWGKRIETFEAGKEYNYGVYLKLTEEGYMGGWRFDKNTKLSINSQSVDLTNKKIDVADDGLTIWFNDVLTIEPEVLVELKPIDVIEINNATIDIKDGDQPIFTGQTPENVPYIYQCEWWNGDDGSGVNSAEFWDKNYDLHITTFESGKTYNYGIYLKAKEGYCFTSHTQLKINGKVYGYHLREGDPELDHPNEMRTLWAITDIFVTPDSSHKHNYGTAWKYDENNHYHECSCGYKNDLAAHSFKWIIDKEATTAEKGSKHEECTVCGYKKAPVEIPMKNTTNKPNNSTKTDVEKDTIKKTDNKTPKTGDNTNIVLTISLLVISAFVLMSLKKKCRV